MSKFVPKPDDAIIEITGPNFQMTINQRYLQSLSAKKSRHFWHIIGKKFKEAKTNGNKKSNSETTN